MITHSHIQLCVYLLAKANGGMIKHQYMKTIIKLTHHLWINTEEKGIKTNVINNIEDMWENSQSKPF